jgi:hypothetical protein
MASEMIKLGGLWVNETKAGEKYFSGKLSPTTNVLIFKNKYKESEKHPDYIMYLAPVKKQEGASDNIANRESQTDNAPLPPEPPAGDGMENDLPF